MRELEWSCGYLSPGMRRMRTRRLVYELYEAAKSNIDSKISIIVTFCGAPSLDQYFLYMKKIKSKAEVTNYLTLQEIHGWCLFDILVHLSKITINTFRLQLSQRSLLRTRLINLSYITMCQLWQWDARVVNYLHCPCRTWGHFKIHLRFKTGEKLSSDMFDASA